MTTKYMKANILKSHPQLFHGSESLPGVHTIVLKYDAAAVIHAPRRVAVAKRLELKGELVKYRMDSCRKLQSPQTG